jgi:small subunit ribosomal protein S1
MADEDEDPDKIEQELFDDLFEGMPETKPAVQKVAPPKEVLEGTVLEFVNTDKRKGAMVDVGRAEPAFLPVGQMTMESTREDSPELLLEKGAKIKVTPMGAEGNVVTVKGLLLDAAWQSIEQTMADGGTVDALVTEIASRQEEDGELNVFGARVTVMGIEGFLPAGQIAGGVPKPAEELIGKTITCSILETDRNLSPGKGKGKSELVLSSKKAAAPKQADKGDMESAGIEYGKLVEGTVKTITDFGAFVEVNGVQGLLHISQISGDDVPTVEDVFAVGDTVKALITSVDKSAGKFSLSTRALEKESGDFLTKKTAVYEKAEETAAEYVKNAKERQDQRDGEVELSEEEEILKLEEELFAELAPAKADLLGEDGQPDLTKFGIFEQQGEGVVAEEDSQMLEDPPVPAFADKTGRSVTVSGLRIPPGLNDVFGIEDFESKGITVGNVVTGKVKGITDFGVFVDVGGWEGLIRTKVVSGEKVEDIEDIFALGDEVKAKVTHIDTKGKYLLSTAALEETPGDFLVGRGGKKPKVAEPEVATPEAAADATPEAEAVATEPEVAEPEKAAAA